MTYSATTLARVDGAWAADDVELSDVEDLDGVVELVRSVVGDDADPVLLFVEENDEWFAVLRLDADDEPRVLISDARVIATSDIAGLFGEAAIDTEVDDADDEPDDDVDEDDEEDEGTAADGAPAGDAALLSDLGTPPARLLALCAEEGQLPSDVITALCEAAGCLEVVEELRGA